MRITFYANACCMVESAGYRLLSDPWLVDGVFEGAWYHAPPLRVTPQDLAGVDALYISHLHPDHFDTETLKHFRRDIPILALDHGQNFLCRILDSAGFTNVVRMKDRETRRFGPFDATVFAPFAGNVYFDSEIGNLLDSALHLRTQTSAIFNANDNTPTVGAAEQLRREYGSPALAQLAYNAAGPFPSSFDNLSWDEKIAAHHTLLRRNFDHLVKVARALGARYVMPFAGSYAIGGRNWRKNACLGTTTWDEAADYVRATAPDLEAVTLNEGLTFDVEEGRVTNGVYTRIDVDARDRYIANVLSKAAYPYETEDLGSRDGIQAFLRTNLGAARANLWKKQQAFDCFPDLNLYIPLEEGSFSFRFDDPSSEFLPPGAPLREPYLVSTLDPRLLFKILNRRQHWNNAEIGCHIDFVRVPDTYLPDVHTLLSFLHLPVPPPRGAGR